MASFDPYHKWFGISLAEQPPSLYRLLGVLPFESDPDVIDAAIEQRVTFLRERATGSYIAEAQRLLNEVAVARLCLLNAETKQNYDLLLRDSMQPIPVASSPSTLAPPSASPFHIPPPPPPVRSNRSVAMPAQSPAGCEWMWTETTVVSGQVASLTTALIDLDDGSATVLLTSFLETQPASDNVIAVCEALAQASETQESKCGLLVEFVDHPQLASATLLSALRISSAIRKPVFEQYAALRQDQPQRDFRLPGLLESLVEKLSDPREFSRLLDLLQDSRPVLSKSAAAQVNSWLIIRKQFEEIKKLLAEEPSLWSRLWSGRHDAKFQEFGLKLAEESRRAMPDALYATDHKGQERCDILKSIGEQLLKPRVLPDSFWRKLASAMSGNGWQILHPRPASLRRPPAEKPLLPQIKRPLIPAEMPKPAVPPRPANETPPIVVTKSPDPVPPSTPDPRKPSATVWLAQIKQRHIETAIALSIVTVLIWGGWQLLQKEFDSSVLAQLASLPKDQQVAAFLKLPDKQFADLMSDPEVLSENSVVFSINDRLGSFDQLKPERHEKWLDVLWPKLTPDKQVDLLVKLPPKERARQLEDLTRTGQGPLIELVNSKATSTVQLTTLARQLDKKQLRLLLSNPAVERRVEVLGGFEPIQLIHLDLSVKTSLSTDQLAALVLDLPTDKLRALLLDIPDAQLKKLFEHRTKNALIEKLKGASPNIVARLLSPKPDSQTASNSTPMPMPVVETKTPPAKDPPKVAPKETRPNPMPPKPVVEVENAKELNSKGGHREPRIVYHDLPKYPRSQAEDRWQQAMVLELPKDAEPFTAIRLRGFEEHRKWFRDKKRPVPKMNEEENGKKLRVVFGSETPPNETPSKTLCTFELRASNLLAFDWEFQPDEPIQLQNAVRSCVLEIQRGEQPAIYVSFLPHKVLEEPLRFGRDGICSLTSSLKEFQWGGSLQLGEGAIHVTAQQGRNAGGKFAFQPSSPPTGPSSPCKIPELCKKFEFSTAEVRLETESAVKGIKEFSTDEQKTQTQLVLAVSRNLNAEEQKKADTLDDKLAVLRTKPSIAKSSKSDPKTRHGALIDILVVLGLPEKKDKPPESPEYAQWAADIVTKDVPAKIKELKDEQGLVKYAAMYERQQFLDLEPVISGTVVRVVEGIVVKALELRPRGIVEPKDTPK